MNDGGYSASRRGYGLCLLRVHADALRYDPAGYLQGWFWRARGLRVRSRNRIAALAGRSQHAYDLWLARREPELLAKVPRRSDGSSIQVVVDCRKSMDGLAATLNSVARAGTNREPWLLGGDGQGERRAGSWSELAQLLEGKEAWLCTIGAGDLLAHGALAVYAEAISQQPGGRSFYADDDLLGELSRRFDPHFKPDWNPDLFENHDFVSGAATIRVTAEDLRTLPPEAAFGSLIRSNSTAVPPVHLPFVLHHRRSRPEPMVPAKLARAESAEKPHVTAIVPTRNKLSLLRNCIDGLRRTEYPRLEIIIVDNGTDEPQAADYLRVLEQDGIRVLRIGGPFNFSALNNAAAQQARGELLCFVNNDVEMLADDWLTILAAQAMRADVGAVGPRLLYPDGTIQHAGVILGIGGGAGHGHRYQRAGDRGYFHRADLPQRVSAVTGACLVVSRDKFMQVGGFDEVEFPVAFNDVDLCLKLRASGWEALYEPRATLIHHESKSRGSDAARANRTRFRGELASLKRKWLTDQHRDPYHHPQLSPFTEQFLIAT